ncbi:alpha/beta hydrolase [Draconibacterium sp. IB214405]|uniref:alpha/beta fold hydrolase n=1 Tax=Draconibacterium sp. IB214405 TaxID=3097352 RepID=UPI002A1333F6|nr:alpha/beta hydrolase [Draconibacterium sp. IB214405]MDX8340037.1 alpha/beta hydrolase [Draconibacterium sp. IB214405]
MFIVLVLISCREKEGNSMRQEKYIRVDDGVDLYVETYGNPENEACLFISGAGANSSFWSEHLCDSLVQNGFFVLKYDHRDFGYSTKIDWDKNPYDFMQLAKDAVSVLDSFHIGKAHVVGHSMGGFIVQLLAIHYPERVLSMTSISSSTNSPTVPLPPDKTWEIYLANKPTGDFETDLDGFLNVWNYLNGTAKFDKELAVAYTKELYKRQPITGALGASHVKAQETLNDRTEVLKAVKIPALVMHGEEDYAVDKYGGIQTAEAIKNSKLVLIPQMGHIPFNYEIRERFENEIIGFIVENKRANTSK